MKFLNYRKKYLIGYVDACKIFLTELLNVLNWILCIKFGFGIFQTHNESYHDHTLLFPLKNISYSGLCHIILSDYPTCLNFGIYWFLYLSLINGQVLTFQASVTATKIYINICLYYIFHIFAYHFVQVPGSCEKLFPENFSTIIVTNLSL